MPDRYGLPILKVPPVILSKKAAKRIKKIGQYPMVDVCFRGIFTLEVEGIDIGLVSSGSGRLKVLSIRRRSITAIGKG